MSRYVGILEAANQGYKRRLSLIEAEQDKLAYAKAMLDVIPQLKVPKGDESPTKQHVTKKLLAAAKKTEKDLKVFVDAAEKIRELNLSAEKLKKTARKAQSRLEKQSRLHKEISHWGAKGVGKFDPDYAEVDRNMRLSLYSFYDSIWAGYLDELL